MSAWAVMRMNIERRDDDRLERVYLDKTNNESLNYNCITLRGLHKHGSEDDLFATDRRLGELFSRGFVGGRRTGKVDDDLVRVGEIGRASCRERV